MSSSTLRMVSDGEWPQHHGSTPSELNGYSRSRRAEPLYKPLPPPAVHGFFAVKAKPSRELSLTASQLYTTRHRIHLLRQSAHVQPRVLTADTESPET